MIAFIICAVMGLGFVGLGIYCFMTKKAQPMGFWANAEVEEMKDVKSYNRAMGKLWIVYGIVFILLCLPLLGGTGEAILLITVLGIMFEAIIAMVVYTVGIEPKYKR